MQQQLAPALLENMQQVAEETGKLENIRHLGGMVAADLTNPNHHPRLGYAVYQQAVKLGALLRPLGNTLYWLPPLNVDLATLTELKSITSRAIAQTFAGA